MPAPQDESRELAHPWLGIDLQVYECHMSDPQVGQLQRLHEITAEQISRYPARTLGILGIAGGNGLDLLDVSATEAVYGFDINPDFLRNCELRYGPRFGGRLHLIETDISGSLSIPPVDLLIANLIIEYVGIDEFVEFAAANANSVEVLSCVIQSNDEAGFVSSTEYSSSFDGLSSVSSVIGPDSLKIAMSAVGYQSIAQGDYPLPNGKILVRQDFRFGGSAR